MSERIKIIHLLLITAFILASCGSGQNGTSVPGTQVGEGTNTPDRDATQTDLLPSATETSTATPTKVLSPTPDLRLTPEQWMDWPIVPTISPRAIQIYEQGLAMGNDPRAFSKVGDCQSITAAFLGIYDKPGQYSLGDQYQSLQETIDYYKGSFGRESQSVRGGFNAAAVLLPLWADPKACNSGETPVECEIRLHRPSILIISLEVWFKGRNPETYAGYMRQIIDYAISKGVLPVLATKADNLEGDQSINYTVASLAYEYDLPLWNFWRAVQPLPDHGIDWVRDSEGFHITVDAWNRRSFTALQVLDAIRHGLAGEVTITPQVTRTATVQTPNPAFTPSPLNDLPYNLSQPFSEAVSPVPIILFDLTRKGLNTTEKLGIFRGDLNGQTWMDLAAAGYSLLDVSPDGSQALIRYANELYTFNLADASRKLLTDQLVRSPLQSAYFLPGNDQVAAILKNGSNGIYLLSTHNPAKTLLTSVEDNPIELIPSRYPDRIFWYKGSCDANQACLTDRIYSTSLDGGSALPAPYPGQVRINSQGTQAYVESSDEAWNYLVLVKGDEAKGLYVPGNRLMDMAWSPDGSTLALSTVTVSAYSGKITENFHTLVTWPGVSTSLYLSEGKVTEKLIWSADSSSLLVMRRVEIDTGYALNFNVVEIASNSILPGGFRLISQDYMALPNLFWLGDTP